MPASVTHPFKICGLKVITIFSNIAHSHQGSVLLFQGEENGKLLAMLNAGSTSRNNEFILRGNNSNKNSSM